MTRSIFLFIVLSSFSLVANSETNDFDRICGFFNELSQIPNIEKMSPEKKADFVGTRIANQLSKDSDARVAWAAIVTAAPHQRYELFKGGAETILPNKWECAAMKQHASTTGDTPLHSK